MFVANLNHRLQFSYQLHGCLLPQKHSLLDDFFVSRQFYDKLYEKGSDDGSDHSRGLET